MRKDRFWYFIPLIGFIFIIRDCFVPNPIWDEFESNTIFWIMEGIQILSLGIVVYATS